MRRLRDECITGLKNAGWRARKLGKGLRKDALRHLPIALRRGETLYRRAARALGKSEPAVADDVVVSLTSFPLRIGKVHHVIASLLDQTVQPGKVVLYLSLAEFPCRTVPKSLLRLEHQRFEIRFVSDNLGPYNKLIHAVPDFPNSWIATADDDRLYPTNWLARLLKGAAESPGAILTTCGRRMTATRGRFLSYRDWPLDDTATPSFLLFPVGSWGTLYPPGSLSPVIGNRGLFQRLAPLNDDVWFKAMSLMHNMPCRALGIRRRIPALYFKNNIRLWDLNQRGRLVDEAVTKVFDHFGLTTDKVLAKEAGRQVMVAPQLIDADAAIRG